MGNFHTLGGNWYSFYMTHDKKSSLTIILGSCFILGVVWEDPFTPLLVTPHYSGCESGASHLKDTIIDKRFCFNMEIKVIHTVSLFTQKF